MKQSFPVEIVAGSRYDAAMRSVTLAAAQMACTPDRSTNLDRAESLVRKAALMGSHIILLQELFDTLYFCQEEDPRHFDLATSLEENPAIQRMKSLAKELAVVLPVSFYERVNQAYYNSCAVIDADGSVLGVYRKSHIPDGPGYEEKYYFSPGDTGFKVWNTRYARLGVGICWDQWFPEAARIMALMGAEVLMYPTAIGSEPKYPGYDSSGHWQRCMQGHAAANLMPLVASNRVGTERFGDSNITFYGRSLIADQTGAILQEADSDFEGVLVQSFDLDIVARQRHSWGVFRDRRPDLYGLLLTLDGNTRRG